jgi:hypothetical protein
MVQHFSIASGGESVHHSNLGQTSHFRQSKAVEAGQEHQVSCNSMVKHASPNLKKNSQESSSQHTILQMSQQSSFARFNPNGNNMSSFKALLLAGSSNPSSIPSSMPGSLKVSPRVQSSNLRAVINFDNLERQKMATKKSNFFLEDDEWRDCLVETENDLRNSIQCARKMLSPKERSGAVPGSDLVTSFVGANVDTSTLVTGAAGRRS